MDGLRDFIKKISDGAKSFAELLDKGALKDDLGKAGTIGSLILLGLDLYEQIKDKLQTDEGRAFSSFYKVAFESAKESIPAEITSIPISDIKSAKQELFQTFRKLDEWNNYLPDHPTIVQFRIHICDIIREALSDNLMQNNNLIRDFIFKFNITLEKKVDNDPDIKPFKEWYRLIERTKDLVRHLEYSRSLIYKADLYQKSLEEYYVENNALYLTDLKTWEKEDDYFRKEKDYAGQERKASEFIISFLKEKPWYTVIAAPFGIGKTSFAIHLTSYFASNYLQDPDIEYNYIPIFVPLKGKLSRIDEDQNSLDDKLRSIAGEGEGKKKRMLIICDGLDEYSEDESKLQDILANKRSEDYPNMKVIITTRLEAGLPQKLDLSSYIRLLPFNKEQVTKFFVKYGIPDITFDILNSYNLTQEEIFKPLFCWMFAIMMNSESFDITTVFKYFDGDVKRSISRALIYQAFIHSIVRGKHKDKTSEYHWTQSHFDEEKRILRKIAALRQMHNPLRRSLIIEGLQYYGISYDETTLKDVVDPVLTSYFYLQSTTALDMSMDFIHKSFREYFLAEYYLESILNDKVHYLNVGIPSPETISFLDGLLELLLENKNENLRKFANNLAKSLLSQTNQQANPSQSNISQILCKNAQKYYEEEQIVFQTDRFESNKIWHIAEFPISKYAELWIHRWLSLCVLNKLAPATPIDKSILADFIVKTSHILPQLPMRLKEVDLSSQSLGHTMLYEANLSRANLTNAILPDAILPDADLSGADLSGAVLYDDDLSDADLSDAIISKADLSGADLTRAFLFHTNLSGADLSGADLSGADLSGADLTYVNLTYADLSGADLSGADLSGADLSGADLSGADLSGADLSNVKINYRTNFENANLTSIHPSSLVRMVKDLALVRYTEAMLSSMDTNQYTSDGKPINP